MEILNYGIGKIVQEFGDAGYPGFPANFEFVQRLTEEGFTVEQAVEILEEAREIDNEEIL